MSVRTKLVEELLATRLSFAYSRLRPEQAERLLHGCLSILFPHFALCPETPAFLLAATDRVEADLVELLAAVDITASKAAGIVEEFFDSLPGVARALNSDATFIHGGDPAAHSVDEVVLAYPGFFAIAAYRIAHELEARHVPIIPRLVSEYAHQKTGIDIHPGCQIGAPFFIDHGTGVVIGETTKIGHRVKVYQGVTLGALSVRKEDARAKRHPTIEDDVILYASAVILGGKTVIGERSIVGGNVWLTESIPAGSVVYRSSEVRMRGTSDPLQHPPVVQTH
ncbi:MAG: serine acetyltransferase [Myxococcales bacterium]|nr:serine acetyltransferase [Myxococcales bacterium]